jgi:hypothetical protein
MKIARILAISFGLVALLAALAACGGDDDSGGTATSTASSQGTTTAAASKTPDGTAAGGATTAAATATTAGGGGIVTSHEGCDLMTADDVAEALGDSASSFENASLGRQSTQAPFTEANQCQWTDFNDTGDTAWLIVSFADSSSASDVMAKLEADCQGQDMISGFGDGACAPQYTGQLRVVKGSVYLDYFVSKTSGGDMLAAEKTLAEKTLARLP